MRGGDNDLEMAQRCKDRPFPEDQWYKGKWERKEKVLKNAMGQPGFSAVFPLK